MLALCVVCVLSPGIPSCTGLYTTHTNTHTRTKVYAIYERTGTTRQTNGTRARAQGAGRSQWQATKTTFCLTVYFLIHILSIIIHCRLAVCGAGATGYILHEYYTVHFSFLSDKQ